MPSRRLELAVYSLKRYRGQKAMAALKAGDVLLVTNFITKPHTALIVKCL